MTTKTLIALLLICVVINKSSAAILERKIVRNKKISNRFIHKGQRHLSSSKEPSAQLKSTVSPKISTKSPKLSTKAPTLSTKSPKKVTKSLKLSTRAPKGAKSTKQPKRTVGDDVDIGNDTASTPSDDVISHAFSDRISIYMSGIIFATVAATWLI